MAGEAVQVHEGGEASEGCLGFMVLGFILLSLWMLDFLFIYDLQC